MWHQYGRTPNIYWDACTVLITGFFKEFCWGQGTIKSGKFCTVRNMLVSSSAWLQQQHCKLMSLLLYLWILCTCAWRPRGFAAHSAINAI